LCSGPRYGSCIFSSISGWTASRGVSPTAIITLARKIRPMLLHDVTLYRKMLRRLTLAELLALYERTVCLYAPLAQAVADEMDSRLVSA
jgi:hypothetical protein